MSRNSFSPDSCHWDGWFTRKAVANPIHTSRPKAPLELRVNFIRCCAWGSLHRGQVPTHGSTLPSRRCFAATWLMRHVVKSSRKLHSRLTTHPHNLSCPVLAWHVPSTRCEVNLFGVASHSCGTSLWTNPAGLRTSFAAPAVFPKNVLNLYLIRV